MSPTTIERPGQPTRSSWQRLTDRVPRRLWKVVGWSALSLVLIVPMTMGLLQSAQYPLLSYLDNGQVREVRPADGCLGIWRIHKKKNHQSLRLVRDYCAWSKPQGVDAWMPVTKEFYRLDAARRQVLELVAFGMLPVEADRVRYTLPGGEIVETQARRHEDLDQPAYWIHLEKVALPVDMAVTAEAEVFARFQIFDVAGREIPVV